MVTLTVLEAENVGQRHDPLEPKHCRAIVGRPERASKAPGLFKKAPRADAFLSDAGRVPQVHVRDPTPKRQRKYEGPPGPAPQVSKPAKKPPRSPGLSEELRAAGQRMVFNQSFSLAPVKTMKGEIYIEIMDHAKRTKRGPLGCAEIGSVSDGAVSAEIATSWSRRRPRPVSDRVAVVRHASTDRGGSQVRRRCVWRICRTSGSRR